MLKADKLYNYCSDALALSFSVCHNMNHASDMHASLRI